jgi:hypothetical protein
MAKLKKSRCPKGSRKIGSRCVKVIKSKPKSIKKYKKQSPKAKKSSVKVDVRGCSRQTSPKYKKRNSPPYPANQCCGRIMKGNDGDMYISKSMSSAGHCRWIKSK